jgi:CBS domain-containing membrane protein
MYVTSCLHPPGGATALTAVTGSTTVHDLGYAFLVTPIALNVGVMLFFALLINNLLPNRHYPNTLKTFREDKDKSSRDAQVQAALSVSQEDIRFALKEMDEFVDVSDEDLGHIFNLSAMHSRQKRMGEKLVKDIMTQDMITVEHDDDIETVWTLMAKHKIRSIPVVDKQNRIEGIITLADFQGQIGGLAAAATDKPEYAGHVMQKNVVTVQPEQHILELVPIFYEKGIHHLPVVDRENHLLGMTTTGDLLIALYAGMQT